jgi:hypothetical protein
MLNQVLRLSLADRKNIEGKIKIFNILIIITLKVLEGGRLLLEVFREYHTSDTTLVCTGSSWIRRDVWISA